VRREKKKNGDEEEKRDRRKEKRGWVLTCRLLMKKVQNRSIEYTRGKRSAGRRTPAALEREDGRSGD